MFDGLRASWRKFAGYSDYLDLFQDYFRETRTPTLQGFTAFLGERKFDERQIDINEISLQVFGLVYFQIANSLNGSGSSRSVARRADVLSSYNQKIPDVLLTIRYHLEDLRRDAHAPRDLPLGVRYSWEQTSAMDNPHHMDHIRNDFGFILSLHPFSDRLLRLMNGEDIPLVAKIISEQQALSAFIATQFASLTQFPQRFRLKREREISLLKNGAMVSFREEERDASNGQKRVFKSLVVSSWVDEIAHWVYQDSRSTSLETLTQTFKVAHLFGRFPQVRRVSPLPSHLNGSSSSSSHGMVTASSSQSLRSFQDFLISRTLNQILFPEIQGELRERFYDLFKLRESARLDFLFFWQALHSLFLDLDSEVRPTIKEIIDIVIPLEGIDPYQRATLMRNRIFSQMITDISDPYITGTSSQSMQNDLAEKTGFLSTLVLNAFILECFVIRKRLEHHEKAILFEGVFERSKRISHRLKRDPEVLVEPHSSQSSGSPIESSPSGFVLVVQKNPENKKGWKEVSLDEDDSSSDSQEHVLSVVVQNENFDQTLYRLLLKYHVPLVCFEGLCENQSVKFGLKIFLSVFDLSCLFLPESDRTAIEGCFNNLRFSILFKQKKSLSEWDSSLQKNFEIGRGLIQEYEIGNDHPAFRYLDSLLCLYLVEQHIPLSNELKNFLFARLILVSAVDRRCCIEEMALLISQQPLPSLVENELEIQTQAIETVERTMNNSFPLISLLATFLYRPFTSGGMDHLVKDCLLLSQEKVFSTWSSFATVHFKSLWDLLCFFPSAPSLPLFRACLGSLKVKFSHFGIEAEEPLTLEKIVSRRVSLVDPFDKSHPRCCEVDSSLSLWVCEEIMPMSEGAKAFLFERLSSVSPECRRKCLIEFSQFTKQRNPRAMRIKMLKGLWRGTLGQAPFQSFLQPESWIDFQMEVIRRIEAISGNSPSLMTLLIVFLYCPYLPCREEGATAPLLLQNLDAINALRGTFNWAEVNTLFIDPEYVNQVDSLTLCLLDSNTVITPSAYTNGDGQRDHLERYLSPLYQGIRDVLIPSNPSEMVIVDMLKGLLDTARRQRVELDPLQGKVDFSGKEELISHLLSTLGVEGCQEMESATYIGEVPTILFMVHCHGQEGSTPLTFEITFWRSLDQLESRTISIPLMPLNELNGILLAPPPKKHEEETAAIPSPGKDVRTASAFKLTLAAVKERENSIPHFFSLLDKMFELIRELPDLNLKTQLLSLQNVEQEQDFCLGEHFHYVLEKWDDFLGGAEGCQQVAEALFRFFRELKIHSRRAIDELYRIPRRPEPKDELQTTLEAIVQTCREYPVAEQFTIGMFGSSAESADPSQLADLRLEFNPMNPNCSVSFCSSSSSVAETSQGPAIPEEPAESLNSFTAILTQREKTTALSMKLGDLLDHPRASHLLRWLIDKVSVEATQS